MIMLINDHHCMINLKGTLCQALLLLIWWRHTLQLVTAFASTPERQKALYHRDSNIWMCSKVEYLNICHLVRIERGGLVSFVEPLPTQKEAGRDKGRLMVNCNCAAKGGNVQTDDFMVQPLHKRCWFAEFDPLLLSRKILAK